VQRSRLALPVAGLAACVLATPAARASAQQSDLAVSPFVTFLPTGGASPLAGLALTLGGGGFALRGSANVSLENSNNVGLLQPGSLRPWGADADAMFLFGHSTGRVRSFAPYLFGGIGTRGGAQDAAYGTTQANWSYGVGASVPLAGPIDIFGESRWRMSRFVLPSASNAPAPRDELRVGVTFHAGRTR
jgi:hypothetical protein